SPPLLLECSHRRQRLGLEARAQRREVFVRQLAHTVVHLGLADRGERLPLLTLPARPLRGVVAGGAGARRAEERGRDEERGDQDQHQTANEERRGVRHSASNSASSRASRARSPPSASAGGGTTGAGRVACAPQRRMVNASTRAPARTAAKG